MEHQQMQQKVKFIPNNEKLLNVFNNCIELKAEVIEDDNQVALYGGKIGDYILIMPAGVCVVLNKIVFETLFQTTPSCPSCNNKNKS